MVLLLLLLKTAFIKLDLIQITWSSDHLTNSAVSLSSSASPSLTHLFHVSASSPAFATFHVSKAFFASVELVVFEVSHDLKAFLLTSSFLF